MDARRPVVLPTLVVPRLGRLDLCALRRRKDSLMAPSINSELLQKLLAGPALSGDTVKVSLHTGDPNRTIGPTEQVHLFLVDADGQRHLCEPTGHNTFGLPDGPFLARRWEIVTADGRHVAKGVFE